MAASKKKARWGRTRIQNLYRHENGSYYVRIHLNGKQVWKSTHSKLLEVAKRRMKSILEDERERAGFVAGSKDRMTVREAVDLREKQLENDPSIKEATRHYWRQCHRTLLKSWPGLGDRELGAIRRQECEEWAGKKFKTSSPTRFNNTAAALKKLFEIGIENGICSVNPADRIKRRRVTQRNLELPDREAFHAWVKAIRGANGRFSRACGDLVELLAYSGLRLGEVKGLRWKDVDLKKGELVVRGEGETGTKNWETRRVPINPPLLQLLKRMRQRRGEVHPEENVTEVFEAQKAMTNAAAKVGIARLTHHDLRHFFATVCIESGVDIPTVAKWLGHKDGGALAMKTYGHLRNEHSREAAKKVTF
ncbi:MAG: site-specific integrase [Verrucomicrobiae bacterium]|nr:site-specific integrase [Verrucomicrobiae bacterium]